MVFRSVVNSSLCFWTVTPPEVLFLICAKSTHSNIFKKCYRKVFKSSVSRVKMLYGDSLVTFKKHFRM
jgi:hypothetical protein